MIISPNVAIEDGWVTGLPDPADHMIGSMSIGITLDHVSDISSGIFLITKEGYCPRLTFPINPVPARGKGLNIWTLDEGSYACKSDIHLALPSYGFAIVTSLPFLTTSGVYIPHMIIQGGYDNQLEFMLSNRGGDLRVEPGTIIGSIMFYDIEDQFLPSFDDVSESWPIGED